MEGIQPDPKYQWHHHQVLLQLENGWPETGKIFEPLYATELEPLFISLHYLRGLFSVPNKVMASAVKYIFDERREAHHEISNKIV